MEHENKNPINFFSEMSEHQISAREFFCTVLLDSLDRNFGLKETVITYFDTQGKFLSWITRNGIQVNCEAHPDMFVSLRRISRNMNRRRSLLIFKVKLSLPEKWKTSVIGATSRLKKGFRQLIAVSV